MNIVSKKQLAHRVFFFFLSCFASCAELDLVAFRKRAVEERRMLNAKFSQVPRERIVVRGHKQIRLRANEIRNS